MAARAQRRRRTLVASQRRAAPMFRRTLSRHCPEPTRDIDSASAEPPQRRRLIAVWIVGAGVQIATSPPPQRMAADGRDRIPREDHDADKETSARGPVTTPPGRRARGLIDRPFRAAARHTLDGERQPPVTRRRWITVESSDRQTCGRGSDWQGRAA